MIETPVNPKQKSSTTRRWIRRGFVLWAIFASGWLANSVRTQGVDDAALRSSPTITVTDEATTFALSPNSSENRTALIFVCGSGIHAHAYAPLLRPIAEAGHAVFVIKLLYRFAPLESHKQAAVERVRRVMASHPEISRWVISGHSLGGALACRVAQSDAQSLSALVLIGTTHPKQDDLSGLRIPVTKVYATNDRIAPSDRLLANKRLLPEHTSWVAIEGGNHSQFGHYGHQLFNGSATISREVQQSAARSAILKTLSEAAR
jgi:hypothetical protein